MNLIDCKRIGAVARGGFWIRIHNRLMHRSSKTVFEIELCKCKTEEASFAANFVQLFFTNSSCVSLLEASSAVTMNENCASI